MDPQCAICHRTNLQLLMLSCQHDPCIDCAAVHYFTGTQFRKEFQYLKQANYWCSICYEPTVIDQTSIQELVKYLGKQGRNVDTVRSTETLRRSKSYRPRNFSRNQRIGHHSPEFAATTKISSKEKNKNKNRPQNIIELASSQQTKHHKIIPHSQYSNEVDFRSSLKGLKSSKNLFQSYKSNPDSPSQPPCQKHLDQLLAYYCFSCNCSICVECALHGSHVGHQVEAIRKASNRLKQIYEKIISQAQRYRTMIANNIKDIAKVAECFKQWNQRHASIIKQKFAQLHELLTQKQKSLISQIQSVQTQGLSLISSQKQKHEQILSQLKTKRKKLKYSINVSPTTWNIAELEKVKSEIKVICESSIVQSFSYRKLEAEVRYVDTGLLTEAVDTIEELVGSFKVSFVRESGK